jgi:hypothetical protein
MVEGNLGQKRKKIRASNLNQGEAYRTQNGPALIPEPRESRALQPLTRNQNTHPVFFCKRDPNLFVKEPTDVPWPCRASHIQGRLEPTGTPGPPSFPDLGFFSVFHRESVGICVSGQRHNSSTHGEGTSMLVGAHPQCPSSARTWTGW